MMNKLLNPNDKLAKFINRHPLFTIVSIFFLVMLVDNL
jgi:hypothetical protein